LIDQEVRTNSVGFIYILVLLWFLWAY